MHKPEHSFGNLYNRLLIENAAVWWVTGAPATGKTTVAGALAQKSGRVLLKASEFWEEQFEYEAWMAFHKSQSELLRLYFTEAFQDWMRSRIFKVSNHKKIVVDGAPISGEGTFVLNQRRKSEVIVLVPSQADWEKYTDKSKNPDFIRNHVRRTWNREILEKKLTEIKHKRQYYYNSEDLSARLQSTE